jgi:hypothetical protein
MRVRADRLALGDMATLYSEVGALYVGEVFTLLVWPEGDRVQVGILHDVAEFEPAPHYELMAADTVIEIVRESP